MPEWKTGDNFEPIRGTLLDDAGEPVNISGAESVRFIASNAAIVVTGDATNLDDNTVPNRGRWEYFWEAEDLTTLGPGEPEVEIEVTWEPGRISTFPSNKERNPTITVTEDLD
jgi:hypothetical protein